MQAIKAVFDGKEIKPTEPIKSRKRTEVLVIFPDEYENKPSEEARKLLRGSGKGERLTERLLKSRAADAFIAALSQIHSGVLVHKDPEYEKIESEIKEYRLPYKLP